MILQDKALQTLTEVIKVNDNNNEITQADLELVKEQAFREGWEQGFEYARSLMNKPIRIPDTEVKHKLGNDMDSFLMRLKW